MKDYIRKRVLEVCSYVLRTRQTVRQTAAVFGVSKSTIHKDMIHRLPILNKELAGRVRVVLEENKAERHIRGGAATKLKYQREQKNEKNSENKADRGQRS